MNDIALLETERIRYKNATAEGTTIFYREAGSPEKPAIVLLHGFPSSSHMFRDLIPKLAKEYYVIAADMPGFGYSDQPSPERFHYSFDHLAEVMDTFLDAIGLTRYSIYVQDYGAPIGFRLFVKHPDRITAIVTQNGNAYREGLGPFWAEVLEPFWKARTPETEEKVRALLTLDGTKSQYTEGMRVPELLNPDSYTFDQMTLDRPDNRQIQLELFYDYRNNIAQYEDWHDVLRAHQPRLLAVWGKNDPIFIATGAESFRRDLPEAEVHFVDSGHFALEDKVDEIAEHVLAFLGKHVG